MANVYIHIPFCKSKCKYCSFVSYPALELKKEYIVALIKEIKKNYKNEILDTLYFGGGTPSILEYNEFSDIINLFKINKNTEITAELNPENINEKYLKNLKNTGINRLSFGSQTFNDEILKLIGRRHCAQDVFNSVKYAKNAEFKNISLDFIYGLPNQTIKMFEEDLNKAVNLDIEHISLYGLKIDKDCYFGKHPPDNLPNEDDQADMYLKAIEILTKNNFKHYEISNFAKDNFSSRHNINYWNNKNYYGFGVGAHGYQNDTRYYNTSDLKKYILSQEHEYSKKLTLQEQLEEEIFLGFRKTDGINIEEINKKFNINFNKKYKKTLDKYLLQEYLLETKQGYKLSDKGILVSNIILAEFLD